MGFLRLWSENNDQANKRAHYNIISRLHSYADRLAARKRLAALAGSEAFFKTEKDPWPREPGTGEDRSLREPRTLWGLL